VQAFKNQAKIIVIACDAPPDENKHLRLIHIVYENYGIVTGYVWVSTKSQNAKSFSSGEQYVKTFPKKSFVTGC